jgi:hypothetical protein
MDQSERFLMQIRAVLVVYRAEVRRTRGGAAGEHMDELIDRSLRLLARAESELDGELATHPELTRALRSARHELRGGRR